MIAETRPNQPITNGLRPVQTERPNLDPLFFPDGTAFKAVDAERKFAETLINTKNAYLNAKKTDPNVKEADYFQSKQELCSIMYPDLSPQAASNNFDRALNALRRDMHDQAVPWNLITDILTPDSGPQIKIYYLTKKDKEYSRKTGVSQPIPVESKNGELITKSTPPPQPNTNGKTPEAQSSVQSGQTQEETFVHSEIGKICGRKTDVIRDRASSIRKKEPNFGRLIGSAFRYSQEQMERLVEELKQSPENGKDREDAKKEVQAEAKREQRGRGEARIDQAKKLQQVPVSFTNFILLHLENKTLADKKPLKGLSKDFQDVLRQSSADKETVGLFIARYSPEKLEQFMLLYFVKTLGDILVDPQRETYLENIERRNKVRLIQKLGGIARIEEMVREHFKKTKKKASVSTSSPER